MLDTLQIVDADSHALEPNDMWERYIESPFATRAPRIRSREHAPTIGDAARARLELLCGEAGVSVESVLRVLVGEQIGLRDMVVDGRPVFEGVTDEMWQRGAEHTLSHYLAALAEGFSPASHVAMLRAQGVDRTYVYPTAGLWILAIEEMASELAAALVRAYNEWLDDYCKTAPDFLHPVAAVCLHDPEAMVNEVRRVAEKGWRSVYLRPNPLHGRTLSDASYEPFWEHCARLGVSVSIHEGTHARIETVGANRFETRFGRHACSHPMEQMMALLALIEGGVLERHPDLRVGFMESGCGWLPYWLFRLDHVEYEHLAWEVSKNVRMKPSDYFRRQCFIACEPSEPGLEEVVRHFGAGCLLYGSDYPHIDHLPSVTTDVELLVARLGRTVATQVLWNNPLRFYSGS